MIYEPEWMTAAWAELGIGEFPGHPDNPRIVAYHNACDDTVSDDEVPWCSSFVNWAIGRANQPRTRSRAARSWLQWGVPITEPIYGCVCILWRESPESWKGHVGFYLGETGDDIIMLGGNQGDEVSVRRYPRGRVLGYRWI